MTRAATLLEVLDEDIRHVEATLLRLDTLRGLLIGGRCGAGEAPGGHPAGRARRTPPRNAGRQQLRRDLAADLGCQENELTLSELLTNWRGRAGAALAERQTRLKTLTAQLKREHTLTVLLSRIVRVQSVAPACFLRPGRQDRHNLQPHRRRQAPDGMALMSMQL